MATQRSFSELHNTQKGEMLSLGTVHGDHGPSKRTSEPLSVISRCALEASSSFDGRSERFLVIAL